MKVDLQAPPKIKEKYGRDSDALIVSMKSKTPQQAADWVEDNVTDLASAKKVLKAYAKAICYLLRNE